MTTPNGACDDTPGYPVHNLGGHDNDTILPDNFDVTRTSGGRTDTTIVTERSQDLQTVSISDENDLQMPNVRLRDQATLRMVARSQLSKRGSGQ